MAANKLVKPFPIILFLAGIGILLLGCSSKTMEKRSPSEMKKSAQDAEFEKECREAGYEWMLMQPTKDGKFIKGAEECLGCMVEGIEHVCDMEMFKELTGR